MDYENYGYASFEDEICQVCNFVLKEHNFPLARVWVPCNQNPGCCGQPSDHVSPNQSVYILLEQQNDLTHPGTRLFKRGWYFSHVLNGQGIVGKALMTNHPVLSTSIASSSNTEDSLSPYSGTDRLRSASVAIPLKSNLYNKGCILECFLPLDCTDPEKQKKMLTALFSTLKKCCKTSCVVSDEVLDENSGFPSPAIQAPQPFNAVEQIFSKENPIEADPNNVIDEIWGNLDAVFQQRLTDKEFEEFKDEISKILDSAFKGYGLPLALAWVPCILNPSCSSGQLTHEDSVSVLEERHNDSIFNLSFLNNHFRSTHLKKDTGIIGKTFMDKKAFFSPSISSSDTALVTIPLKSNIHNSECVLEFLLPLDCRDLEEQRKQLIALFSTLNQSCKTLHVVADKVVDEQSNSFFLVLPSVASDSSVPKVDLREAHPSQMRPFFPESSDQNAKRPDPPPRMEPAEIRNDIGLCSLAASETSEARRATVKKTVNVPNTSPNNSAKSTGGKSTGGAKRKWHWAWEFCEENPDNKNGVICSLCGKKLNSGGITRFVSHISRSDPSKNVRKCKKVSPEDTVTIEKMTKENDYL